MDLKLKSQCEAEVGIEHLDSDYRDRLWSYVNNSVKLPSRTLEDYVEAYTKLIDLCIRFQTASNGW